MKDVLLYMLESIAEQPEKLSVEEKIQDGQHDFYISADQSDIGRIIGKRGKIIKALRRVLTILAVREGKRVNIIMEEQ